MTLHQPHRLFREERVPQADDRVIATSYWNRKMNISCWGPTLGPSPEARPQTPAKPGRWQGGLCYHPFLCLSHPGPSTTMPSRACVTMPPPVPMSRDQSGKKGGQKEARGCRAFSSALTLPTSPAALTPVLPGQLLLYDMKITYPRNSCLGSNQSKESLFLSSALKTYNSKEGWLWAGRGLRRASEPGVGRSYRQGWGEARKVTTSSPKEKSSPRNPAQGSPCS